MFLWNPEKRAPIPQRATKRLSLSWTSEAQKNLKDKEAQFLVVEAERGTEGSKEETQT